MEAQIANLVQESLSLYLYDNACFLAERLVAEYPNEVRFVTFLVVIDVVYLSDHHHHTTLSWLPQGNKYLLATCYFHNQQINRAYYTLQGDPIVHMDMHTQEHPQPCFTLLHTPRVHPTQ